MPASGCRRCATPSARIIFGQAEAIELTLTAILAGGHALLVGAPGLAKTKLATSLGRVLGLDEKRVQFTPDLMPADILGSEVLDEIGDRAAASSASCRALSSASCLMADEINRASPRTQSALLQAMQEHHVTVAGVRHDVPRPFPCSRDPEPDRAGRHLSLAGSPARPLPVRDRRALSCRSMPNGACSSPPPAPRKTTAEPVLTTADLLATQRLVRLIPVGEQVADAILKIVRAARPGPEADEFVNKNVAWGPSPRASQALMLGARARALLDSRLSPSIDDVLALAGPVFRHRMALSFTARADGHTIDSVIERLKSAIG